MAIDLYTHDTTADNAAQISADRGEIVSLKCSGEAERQAVLAELAVLLDDSDSAQSSPTDPIEAWGDLDGAPVRVHLYLA